MRVLVAVVLMGLALPVAAQSAILHQQIVEGAIEDFIRPTFAKFAEEAEALEVGTARLCEVPDAVTLAYVRTRFVTTVLAFSRAEFVRIGPLGVGDRLERLLFWPDRKGIALRQVQGALAEEDATATSPDTLQNKSVAMQGLVALEYLLFGTGSDDLKKDGNMYSGAYRCAYAKASTTLISQLATTISSEWNDTSPGSPAEALLNPKSDAADYRTETEVLEKLAATMIHGTEAIRDQRIAPIISESTGKPKPRSALFWRSNLTAKALEANFAGLHYFFVGAKFRDAISPENEWVADGATFEFANAERGVAAITSPMEQAVADPRQLQALRYLVVVTKSLDTLLGQNLAAALGLSVGFSTLDGD